jgi:hypothetical protein
VRKWISSTVHWLTWEGNNDMIRPFLRMTQSSMKLSALALLLILPMLAPGADGAPQVDKKEIVRQSRAAYYSLRRLGLIEFECSVKPNWELVLQEQLKADPPSAQTALKLLNGLHFVVTLDPNGQVKLTHTADQAAPNAKAAEGFKDIFDGMDQAMSGFFDTWSPFMLSSPFPAVESDYLLEDLGDGYRLSYKDGDASVVTSVTRDFGITEVLVSSARFKSSLKPQFTKTGQGFVLSGYEALYTGTSEATAVHLHVKINNQDVNGLQLPQKLNLDGVYNGSSFAMELVFTDYNVKLR